MDTQETNESVNTEALENSKEQVMPETTADVAEMEINNDGKSEQPASSVDYGQLTKAQIIARIEGLIEEPVEKVKKEIDSLKQCFYKLHNQEEENKLKEFVDAGGVKEDYVSEEDSLEVMLKNLLATYKEKRMQLLQEQEQIRETVQKARLAIIDKLKDLTENPGDINKSYTDFKALQQEWDELKNKTQVISNEIWKNYQLYVEKFYDYVKINNEFRDYDFKKNLELKTALCEAVEKLDQEEDVISAFHQLQKFHQDWKETGPVAKELREELWQRFKAASTVINKKHQLYYDNMRMAEAKNQEAKEAICKKMEAIEYDALKTIKEWEGKAKEIIALQEEWKSIGFTPRKTGAKLYEQFRAYCDEFFKRKSEFYKEIKGEMNRNLELKIALCEKAEALKESTDWKATTDVLVKLQKDWKAIGPVARKSSEQIWKRFSAACDHFFEQKNAVFSTQKVEEQENLQKKRQLIENIRTIDVTLPQNEALVNIRGLVKEWNAIGFVPFKEKDKLYKEYHAALDEQFTRLNVDEASRRLNSYKDSIMELSGTEQASNKLYRERDKLVRMYENMKSELYTCENNIGFFNVSSKNKKGSGLLKDLERKIDKLKEDISLVLKKIELIDQNLEEK